MILRLFSHLPPVLLSILVFVLSSARADDTSTSFDCHVTVDGVKFDLTSLAGEHIVNQTRNSPPSTTVQSLRFNLCDGLKKLEGFSDQDQVRTSWFPQMYIHLIRHKYSATQPPEHV